MYVCGAHKGRCVATVGVLLCKEGAANGPRVERSEQKQGVLRQSIGKTVHTQGGAHTRRCAPRAVHRPFYFCYFRGKVGLAPALRRSEPKQEAAWRSIGKALHTEAGAHTRRCTPRAVHTKGEYC